MASHLKTDALPRALDGGNIAPVRTKLLVLGGGGHASDVLSIIEDNGLDWSIIVADDTDVDPGRFVPRGVEVKLGIAAALENFGGRYVSGVGYPRVRQELVLLADQLDAKAADPLIHRLAHVQNCVGIGDGTVVSGFAWLSALCSIGEHVYLGYGAKIGHDSIVGDFSSVMPGAFVAGEVVIGDGVLVGANATILEGRRIGDGARIGAGSVITKDVAAGETVIGITRG